MRAHRTIPLWANISNEQWHDWKWQLQNVVTTRVELEQIIQLTDVEKAGIDEATKHLLMRITPHIASLMSPVNPEDTFRRQFVPTRYELASAEDATLFDDVNADDAYSPVSGLIHRYPTKVLIFPSNFCGAYCRYCFRRKLPRETETTLSREGMKAAIAYLAKHPEVEEVILSGGDPLTIDDDQLDRLLSQLHCLEHISIVRLHTRMPITVPYRVTPRLLGVLRDHKQRFSIHTVMHIDTAEELSPPTRKAIADLVDSGIPCYSSCPLLRGINDSADALKELFTELVKLRVKPYYLFHSDPVRGLRHFLVPISRGLEIMWNLYDRMSGLAMPHYCFNSPGGGGHVLLGGEYVRNVGPGKYEITTFEGDKLLYTEIQNGEELRVETTPLDL